MGNNNLWKGLSLTVALVLLPVAALAAPDTNTMPPPGTLNYVEGQVLVQGQNQTPKSVGETYLGPNQVLDTRSGNAEVLLTPGVYLRVGHNSEVEMVSPELTNTEVRLNSGSAMLEVDQLFKENDVSVLVDNARATIESKGLYGFEAGPASVATLDGKALVNEGDQHLTLKKGHEVLLENAELKARSLPKDGVENDPLYRWSKLRSEYASESNVSVGNALLAEGGWFGPGWYWDPFWTDFAFLPGAGMFWGPFGWPFFSPGLVGWAPYYGVYGYRGVYRYPVAVNRGKEVPTLARHAVPGSGFGSTPRAMSAPGMMGSPHMGSMGMPMGPAMGGHVGAIGGVRGGRG